MLLFFKMKKKAFACEISKKEHSLIKNKQLENGMASSLKKKKKKKKIGTNSS